MKDLRTQPAKKNSAASTNTVPALHIAHCNPRAEARRITDVYAIYNGIDDATGEESITFFLLPDPYADQTTTDQYYTTGEVDTAANEEFFK